MPVLLKWALLRKEMPQRAVCCERLAERHRQFINDIPTRLLTVKLRYDRRKLRCKYCFASATLIGLLVVDPPACLQQVTQSQDCYVSADILEIDEGEYDATKPPPITEEV